MWIPTKRVCGCCERENLFAQLTGPSKPDKFGKRLYTYVCRQCDLGTAPGSLWVLLDQAGEAPEHPGYT